ncbi:MAG: hypothetical protein KatS3mg105_0338 [Gemmatales bacterium]|nr:MAG: hypothetical protein KatS3mg105_0338 [Gemmatales bacterium]
MAVVCWNGVVVVAAMYAVFLAVGLVAARRSQEGTASDLMIAGRAMPFWLATCTMIATWVDGGYLLGTAQYAFDYDPENGILGVSAALQGGVCFGISLILGGLFFAHIMRRLEFTTIVDPFDARFGKKWAAVLFLPAMLGELFWSGALLVAIGSTFSVLLDIDLTTGILLSAAVVTLYTMVGGMWSVAFTDAFQLALIPVGMLMSLPFVLERTGGFVTTFEKYVAGRPGVDRLFPPLQPSDGWTLPAIVNWWDMTIMLTLGGIPWNCYFQRVLACQSPRKAQAHSIVAGVFTMILTIPPLILGMAAFVLWGNADGAAASAIRSDPSKTLPMLLKETAPFPVLAMGLAAIIGAVTSSFSSSILSAGSMFGWNVYRRLVAPGVTVDRLKTVIRLAIVLLGVGAVALALKVQSVAQLWLFTADLVFVLLFPQLLASLYDPAANRIGSVVAFVVSLFLRLGGGIAELDMPPFLPYDSCLAWFGCNDFAAVSAFPVRTFAAAAGLLLLPVVSRLTSRWDPPRALTRGSSVDDFLCEP